MESPAYSPPPHRMRPGVIIALILGFVAAMLTLALMFEAGFFGRLLPSTNDAEFSLHDNGVAWYALTGSSAAHADAPARFSEITGSASQSGIIESAADGPRGIVAYSYMDPEEAAQALASKKPIVSGETKNPSWPYALVVADASQGSSTPRFTAAGYGAAFNASGALLALSPEGVSVYSLADGSRTTIIPMRGVNVPAFALSADASYAALPNPATHALDIFSISASGSSASYLGSIPVDALAAGFTEDGRLIVKTGEAEGVVYSVSSAGAKQIGTITFEP